MINNNDKKNSDKPVYSGNSIMVRPNGPLICRGDVAITLQNADGELILKDNEFALCRCGLSKNKPFCDSSHKKDSEEMTQSFTDNMEENISGVDGELIITIKNNSMYSAKGPVTIFSRDGASKTTRVKAALCRCGHSENKPFCDGKHNKYGFIA